MHDTLMCAANHRKQCVGQWGSLRDRVSVTFLKTDQDTSLA